MPAKSSKPKKANSVAWTPSIGSAPNRKVSVKSGITKDELEQRRERYLYLKRKNLTFV